MVNRQPKRNRHTRSQPLLLSALPHSKLPNLTSSLLQYSEEKTLWQARHQPFPDPNLPPPVIQLPFEFQLPPLELGLPPSFERGTRSGSALGNQVGRIACESETSGLDREERSTPADLRRFAFFRSSFRLRQDPRQEACDFLDR